jgi:crotonobetainyl-CoA hydratase
MSEAVRIECYGKVLTITLDRPKANAIDALTSRELGQAFAAFRDDPKLLVAIITGGGDRIFSAGWDLKAAAEQGLDEDEDYGVGGFAGITEMFDLDKPVIAAVNGVAVGGGVEIALACDLVVAVDHATFSLPETFVGVAADGGGLQRLPRKVPINVALDMLMTGRKMDMEEAKHFGLVNYVVTVDELMSRTRELAEHIAEGAPLSIRTIKEVVQGSIDMTVEEAFAATREKRFPIHAAMLKSEDHEEGPRAFAEKRKPVWKGK